MKKLCKKNNAIKYAYQFMTESEEKRYKAHLKECEKCRLLLNKIIRLRKIVDYRQKIKDKLPLVNKLQYPEKIHYSALLGKYIAQIRNKKVLKFALSASFVLIMIFAAGLFFSKKEPTAKDARMVIKETKKEKFPKIKSERKITIKRASEASEASIKEREQKWCFNTGGALRLQPVFQNNTLYFGSDDNRAYSINSETGKLIWEYQTGGRIVSPPTINNDFIYISSSDGFLYKLNSQTGKLSWRKETGTLVESQIFIYQSFIYVANNKGEIISLDLDGRELWKKNIDSIICSSISCDEKSIYFGTVRGDVFSLSKTNGSVNWGYSTISPFISSKPLVVDNQLIIGNTDGVLYSFNKLNGELSWEYKTGNQIVADPIYFQNRLYFASDKLYCFDLAGKKVWEYKTMSSIDINFSVCGNILTAIDKRNSVYSINVQTGNCLKKHISDETILSFICARDRIFIGNEEGEICRLK